MSYKTIPCSSARDILAKLSPHGKHFHEADICDWIFRGQAKADWNLEPSAFRSEKKLVRFAHAEWPEWTNREQILTEARTLAVFVDEADRGGLPLPGDLALLREEFDKPFQENWYVQAIESGQASWPPRSTWNVIALAQHYGIATRFLDWTRSPLAAAYFAAAGAFARPADEDADIAVWAFSTNLENLKIGLTTLTDRHADRPQVVTAPYSISPNLHAQRGVHIARAASGLPWNGLAEREDFSTYLEKVEAFTQRLGQNALLKFTLPKSEAGALLWHLAKTGVTPGSLFPGYAGAAMSTLEHNVRTRHA